MTSARHDTVVWQTAARQATFTELVEWQALKLRGFFVGRFSATHQAIAIKCVSKMFIGQLKKFMGLKVSFASMPSARSNYGYGRRQDLAFQQASLRMFRQQNIPTEILRTVMAISETGSLSKAAERLQLTQPAISSQVKRLQAVVGGEVFERTPNGTTLTDLGKLLVQHAKRALDAHDQIVMLGGREVHLQQIKLGLSTLFAKDFYASTPAELLDGASVQFDKSGPLAKGLVDGYIDVACIYEIQNYANEIADFVVNETSEPLFWVRSKDFVLTPGKPLPVIAWAGDDWMLRTLDRQGTAYKIVANSPDYHAKLIALQAGIGVSALPRRRIPKSVVVAEEDYFPKLPPIKTLLCARPDETTLSVDILKHLSKLFFGPSDDHRARGGRPSAQMSGE